MSDNVVLTINKLTKIESDDDATVYRANLSGRYVHPGEVASIVDIKITLESQDKTALGKVGESRRVVISPINATLDDFSVKVEHSGKNKVVQVAAEMINQFGIEGARDVMDAVQKAKQDNEDGTSS
jgi:hypothetical protein